MPDTPVEADQHAHKTYCTDPTGYEQKHDVRLQQWLLSQLGRLPSGAAAVAVRRAVRKAHMQACNKLETPATAFAEGVTWKE